MNMLAEIVTESWSWPWWTVMVLINAFSVCILFYLIGKAAYQIKQNPSERKYRITMIVFGCIYTAVAMYRSIFVSNYEGQLAWFDTIANSSFVIRSLATFAEISFAFLVALPLIHQGKEVLFNEKLEAKPGLVKFLKAGPYVLITCLITAQCFAWSGLLTQYELFFAIEETLWGIAFIAILPLVIVQLRNLFKYHKGEKAYSYYKVSNIILAIFTVGYVIYQCGYHLPFGCYMQAIPQFGNGLPFGFNLDSLKRILFDFNPTRSYETWGGLMFFIWHSGYFSICVWMNLIFAGGPRLIKEKEIQRD